MKRRAIVAVITGLTLLLTPEVAAAGADREGPPAQILACPVAASTTSTTTTARVLADYPACGVVRVRQTRYDSGIRYYYHHWVGLGGTATVTQTNGYFVRAEYQVYHPDTGTGPWVDIPR